MAKWHKSTYDDDALVEAIARGDRPCSRIAEEMGLSRHYVAEIARGCARHDLWPRIRAARRRVIEQDRLRGGVLAEKAVARLAKLIGPGSDAPVDVQCRAAVDILHLAAGDRHPARRRWKGYRRRGRRAGAARNGRGREQGTGSREQGRTLNIEY